MSSAVVLCSLGAAGTLVGAALGSVCIAVGGAVYSHYLSMTKDRVTGQGLATGVLAAWFSPVRQFRVFVVRGARG